MVNKAVNERRKEERHPYSGYCGMIAEGISNPAPLIAKTLDISQNGAKIRYIGEPLSNGKRISIYIMGLNLKGYMVKEDRRNRSPCRP